VSRATPSSNAKSKLENVHEAAAEDPFDSCTAVRTLVVPVRTAQTPIRTRSTEGDLLRKGLVRVEILAGPKLFAVIRGLEKTMKSVQRREIPSCSPFRARIRLVEAGRSSSHPPYPVHGRVLVLSSG
jgi:hypothetical protein